MVNKQGQWAMKMAIFFPFSPFRIEGQKQHAVDIQSYFSMSKIGGILPNFNFIEQYNQRRPTFIMDILG